jgi:hypothetical protein
MKNTDFKAHRWVVELTDPLIFWSYCQMWCMRSGGVPV